MASSSYPQHSGDSPFSFSIIAEPSAEFPLSDRQPGTLDSYKFSDSEQYQIQVELPVSRYIGNVAEAVSNGTLSPTARLVIPAYDVDQHTSLTADCDGDGIPDSLMPEKDEVYFNGEFIGVLSGEDSIWKFNDSLTVPITKVNFPSAPGAVATNTVSIAIDTANRSILLSNGDVGCRVWGVSIDWVGLKFEAADPVYLLTGLGGNSQGFENSNYIDNVKSSTGLRAKILDHSAVSFGFGCRPGELAAVQDHANSHIDKIKEDSELHGSHEFHLVGHSMGGLGGRMLISNTEDTDIPVKVATMDGQPVYQNLKTRSLITHGSPHLGTLLADIGGVLSSGITDFCDLKPATWAIANPTLTSRKGAKVAVIGAAADGNDDQSLSLTEVLGNQVADVGEANKLYYILYYYDSAEWIVVYRDVFGVPVPGVELSLIGDSQLNPNDTMVTVASALAATGAISQTELDGVNHGTVIEGTAQSTAISIGTSSPGWGDLK